MFNTVAQGVGNLNTLAPSCFRGFSEKKRLTHVALCGNISAPVQVTDLVEASKDAASLLVCTRKKFLLGGCGFL